MLMPFGRYRGSCLNELPDGYLIWLAENVELREPLLSGVLMEFKERGLTMDQRPTTANPEPDKVKAAYRELSQRFHPDRIGGDGEAQRALNLFYEKLTGRG
jgi:uncharacterized protein (DUF3820 family)